MSEPELIRACKLWDKITEKMHRGEYEMPEQLEHRGSNQPYSGGDFSPLQCTIDGKKAELTVGSSAGHRVHVDLEQGVLEYYDNDSDPNQVMHDLLEEAGLKCETEYEGVKCKGVKKDNVQEVFKVLAMPTSMDFRLNECKKSKVDPEQECQDQVDNTTMEDLGYREPPSGCNCNDFWEDYKQDCIDNFDYSAYNGDSDEDCNEVEKQFFRSGPKRETLTKQELIVNPRSQKKISEWE